LKSAVYTVQIGPYALSAYAALFAVIVNYMTTLGVSMVLGTRGQGVDRTAAEDYFEDSLT
jgi:hypothetical protein